MTMQMPTINKKSSELRTSCSGLTTLCLLHRYQSSVVSPAQFSLMDYRTPSPSTLMCSVVHRELGRAWGPGAAKAMFSAHWMTGRINWYFLSLQQFQGNKTKKCACFLIFFFWPDIHFNTRNCMKCSLWWLSLL